MYTTIYDARWAAVRRYPLAVNLILSLQPVRTTKLPGPVGIDKYWRIYYNPDLLSKLTPAQAAGAVLCEVGHILYRHGKRGQWLLGENPTPHQAKLWNRAADLALHYGLSLEGVQLPEGLELPSDLGYEDGLSAEDYFCLLEEQFPEPQEQPGNQPHPQGQPGQGQGGGGGGQQGQQQGQQQGDGQGQGNGQPQNQQLPPETKTKPPEDQQHKPQDPSQQDQQPEDGQGQGESQGQPDQPQDQQEPEPDPNRPEAQPGGSAADGIPREWELGEDAELENEWNRNGGNGRDGLLFSAAQSLERSRGDKPGQAGHWATDIVKPKSDPLAKLRHVLTKKVEQFQSGQGDFSYRRPSRRSTGNVLLSGNVAPVPRIAILIDTSGSMTGGDDIGIALGMVNRVIKGLNLTEGVEYYCGDTRLVSRGKVTNAKDIKLGGGGGTSMELLIQQIAEPQDKRLQPDIVICCTDAETNWPPHRLKIPVIAAVTRGNSYTQEWVQRIPSWIDTVVLHASPSERRRLGV